MEWMIHKLEPRRKKSSRQKYEPEVIEYGAYDVEKNPWELRGKTLELMKIVKRYTWYEGDKNRDRAVEITIDPSESHLFTPRIHNSLVKGASLWFGGIVSIEYAFSRKPKFRERPKSIPENYLICESRVALSADYIFI